MDIGCVEITNMVMIYNKNTNQVLVQNRCRTWKGIAFPGGHLEPGESLYDSAVREIKEETGLDVIDLKYCGMIHWCYSECKDHTLIYYYKTDKYFGELITENEEGQNFWVDISTVRDMELAPGFDRQIEMFFNDHSELFILCDESTGERTYRWQ